MRPALHVKHGHAAGLVMRRFPKGCSTDSKCAPNVSDDKSSNHRQYQKGSDNCEGFQPFVVFCLRSKKEQVSSQHADSRNHARPEGTLEEAAEKKTEGKDRRYHEQQDRILHCCRMLLLT
jgi:hypothetical protein